MAALTFSPKAAVRKSIHHQVSAVIFLMTSSVILDSFLSHDVLGADQAATIFHRLKDEVPWTTMMHKGGEVPRLVALQHSPGPDGAIPIYRHPIDNEPPTTPFTPTVDLIRRTIEAKFHLHLNHCLIQLYRSGQDFIGEHSDKTLDISRGTPIVNYSAGATRQMILKPKRDAQGQRGSSTRIELPHDSLFILGWETNKAMTHGIRQDRRAITEKRPDELVENGERVSLTFRNIATFHTQIDGNPRLFGQGARCKTKDEAMSNTSAAMDVKDEQDLLLKAFMAENRQSDFDWDHAYGAGFDIITIDNSDNKC